MRIKPLLRLCVQTYTKLGRLVKIVLSKPERAVDSEVICGFSLPYYYQHILCFIKIKIFRSNLTVSKYFSRAIDKIKRNTKEIERLLDKASKTYELSEPPKGLEGCKDCGRLEELINMVTG